MSLLTDELKSWIGREVHYPAREELGRASIRYFALALGDDNPLYVNGEIAPPTLICETNQYAHRAPNADGYIGHEWHLPVPNTRLVRGLPVMTSSALKLIRMYVLSTLGSPSDGCGWRRRSTLTAETRSSRSQTRPQISTLLPVSSRRVRATSYRTYNCWRAHSGFLTSSLALVPTRRSFHTIDTKCS